MTDILVERETQVLVESADGGVLVAHEREVEIVIEIPGTGVLLEQPQREILVLREEADGVLLEQPERSIDILTEGLQGPPGPRGLPGIAGAAFVTRTAGAVISANTVVYERDDLIFPLSYNDSNNVFAILGLAVSAGLPGAEISVQRGASVTDSAWSWVFGRVYLGQGGALTQVPPHDGYQVLIGFAASPDSINLSIQDPIEV
ncbi:hypothetical protein [Diaphorobacter caeni]|uniref:hypothetical protein n=1 Tax=Diaphorobacter caeni TaxID=2784387 RepID=UPI00188E774A|nr:hypothetical protein [Diaphorobacter caeni]MBF5006836.1 hypothetical protein [Diaphorobacter caeni]